MFIFYLSTMCLFHVIPCYRSIISLLRLPPVHDVGSPPPSTCRPGTSLGSPCRSCGSFIEYYMVMI